MGEDCCTYVCNGTFTELRQRPDALPPVCFNSAMELSSRKPRTPPNERHLEQPSSLHSLANALHRYCGTLLQVNGFGFYIEFNAVPGLDLLNGKISLPLDKWISQLGSGGFGMYVNKDSNGYVWLVCGMGCLCMSHDLTCAKRAPHCTQT